MSAGDDYAGFLHRFVLFPGRYITFCCAVPYYILFCIYLISGEVYAMYERIRNLREDHDLKQEDIARLLHCTQACYSNYETGKRDIPTEVLHTLADYYHVSIDYLLGRTSRKEPYPK